MRTIPDTEDVESVVHVWSNMLQHVLCNSVQCSSNSLLVLLEAYGKMGGHKSVFYIASGGKN